MYRTMEFRAWDKVLERFLSDEEVNKYPVEALKTLDNRTVIFTQYTGIRDKNDNKIFEDDFITDFGPGAKNWRITYSEGCFVASGAGRMRALRMMYCEVIGNKYENPTIICPR